MDIILIETMCYFRLYAQDWYSMVLVYTYFYVLEQYIMAYYQGFDAANRGMAECSINASRQSRYRQPYFCIEEA